METPAKYEVNDTISFENGYGKHTSGVGKIMFAQNYPLCHAYTVKLSDGSFTQVREENVKELLNEQ